MVYLVYISEMITLNAPAGRRIIIYNMAGMAVRLCLTVVSSCN